MLDTVKYLVRLPRIIQLNKRYNRMLDEQYISYDAWIRNKELDYLAALGKSNLTSILVPYEAVGANWNGEEISEDIVIFVHNTANLDANAVNVIEDYFYKNADAKLVYGDEDEFNSNKTVRMNPVFRPDWSPDTLYSYLYMGSVIAVRRSVLVEVQKKGWDDGLQPVNIYELVCKLTAGMNATSVCHINYVLYHSSSVKSLFMLDDEERARKSIVDEYIPEEYGNVTVVIPSRDNPEVLCQLLNSMIKFTTDAKYDVVIIDNGSTQENQIKIKSMLGDISLRSKKAVSINYVVSEQPFNFSKICNEGASHATGEYLLFLNDDMEIRDGKWMQKMLFFAHKNHVGAVGAKLYYPKSKMIQHCGITNLRLGPVHKLQYKEDNRVYYDHCNDVDRDVLGVTGACLMIRKELFDRVGGFDESLAVAFNDVDLCYTLYERGYHNVVVNTTHLWHYESLSRGDDESKEKLERLAHERTKLYEKHPDIYGKDPYYHDYLTRDILDSNYTYKYEYEYDGDKGPQVAAPKKVSYPDADKWYNECLIISLEQCGTLEYWLGPKESTKGDDKTIYIGGYSFVAGSDNSCFEFKLLLKSDEGEYEVPLNGLYRPDLEINLDAEEKASLCGFSVRLDTTGMPKGDYRVGIYARSKVARLKLLRYSNRYIHL